MIRIIIMKVEILFMKVSSSSFWARLRSNPWVSVFESAAQNQLLEIPDKFSLIVLQTVLISY